MAGITINGTNYPSAKCKFGKYELDLESGRNLEGVMERTVLRHHPRKLFLEFPPMNETEMYNLLTNLDHSTLSVTTYNPFTKSNVTMSMMHGDLIPEIYWDGVDPVTNQKQILYQPLSVELVEY